MIRSLARLGIVAGAVSVAIWLLPASVAIVSWRAGGPSRLAFLSPLSSFWLALASVTAAVVIAASVWRTTGRSLPEFARACAPLSILFLWLVPFVPWIADRAPALLIFAGPLRWAVVATAIAGVVDATGGWTWLYDRFRALRVDPRLALVVAFLVYAAMGVRFARQAGFGGDEPHYLVIAHSLLVDHDLDIANNHERGDYSAFFPGTLRPDYLTRGQHGEIYSIHAPGLPALLLPAYAAGGALGAVIFVALLAALASTAMLMVAERLAGPQVGLLTWLGVSFSVPMVPHAWLIYPEAPAAFVLACAVLWLWERPGPLWRTTLHGLLLALLPWLHTKFVIFLAVFAAFEVLRLWPDRRRLLAFLAPIAVVSSVWLWSFYWMYGTFDPQAPYGVSSRTLVVGQNIPRGLLGFLADQKFGLLFYSPLYVLAIPGAWRLVRDRTTRVPAAVAVLATVVFVLSTTRFYMWWGGSSAPSRFLVPIVPLLAPMVACALARLDGLLGRTVTVMAVALTLGVTIVAVASPGERLLYSDPHGRAALLGAVQGPAPLDVLLPTFTEEDWRAPLALLWPWAGSLAIASVALYAMVRLRALRTRFSAGVIGVTVVLAGSGVAASRASAAARALAAKRGQLAMLDAYDPSRFHPVDASRGTRLDDDVVRSLTTVDFSPTRGETPQPAPLPEGRYEARVWFGGALARSGDIQIASPQDAVYASAAGPLPNPTSIAFTMPITAPVVVRLTDSASTPRRVEVSPVTLVPRSARIIESAASVERIGEGGLRGLLAYADDRAYPEGGVYWTRGTERSSAVLVTDNAAGVRLILHVGPTGGHVEVGVGGTNLNLEMKPNETRAIPLELGGGMARTVISVRAARSFVPAEHEKGSADRRSLGCQVRPVLF